MRSRNQVFVGTRDEAIAFVLSLSAGTRWRIFVAWNHSFHNAAFDVGILYGPAVRNPHAISDIDRVFWEANKQAVERWELSRKAT